MRNVLVRSDNDGLALDPCQHIGCGSPAMMRGEDQGPVSKMLEQATGKGQYVSIQPVYNRQFIVSCNIE